MASYKNKDIKRGRMTTEEKAEILRLSEAMNDPTPSKIARKINRHHATVNWFMLQKGLVERKTRRAPRVYQRNGKTIYPYSEEQDRRIETMRARGSSFSEIATTITAEFGIERSAHSVHVRLVQLSADPDREI